MRARLWTTSSASHAPQAPPPCCDICHEVLGRERLDGRIEYASILPCSHVFGSICISRWLEKDSLHQDCPLCRRRMIYRECGHIIKSCDVDRAPKCVREKDMPKKCFACRGAARVEELKLRDKKKPGQERGLQGLGLGPRIYLPRVLGGLRRNAVTAVDWNIDEFRRDWRAEIDAIFGNVEQDRRDQW